MAEACEYFPILRECRFGFVTQTHQRLFASLLMSAVQDIFNFGGCHGPGIGIPGIFPECAITATIAAEVCYREKDLSRISDGMAFEPIAKRSRGIEE
jgi:hypothetical protein